MPSRLTSVLLPAAVGGLAWLAILLLLGLPAIVALATAAVAFTAAVLALSVSSATREDEELVVAEPEAVEPEPHARWSREGQRTRTPDRAA